MYHDLLMTLVNEPIFVNKDLNHNISLIMGLIII